MTEERAEEKQVEVIAEKSRTVAYVYLLLAALGVALVAAGLFILVYFKISDMDRTVLVVAICLLAVGAVMLFTFAGLYISRLYRPYALITLKDGELIFPDGTKCKPDEITAVEVKKEFGKCGKLSISLPDRKIEVGGVAKYEKACTKLSILAGKPLGE